MSFILLPPEMLYSKRVLGIIHYHRIIPDQNWNSNRYRSFATLLNDQYTNYANPYKADSLSRLKTPQFTAADFDPRFIT